MPVLFSWYPMDFCFLFLIFVLRCWARSLPHSFWYRFCRKASHRTKLLESPPIIVCFRNPLFLGWHFLSWRNGGLLHMYLLDRYWRSDWLAASLRWTNAHLAFITYHPSASPSIFSALYMLMAWKILALLLSETQAQGSALVCAHIPRSLFKVCTDDCGSSAEIEISIILMLLLSRSILFILIRASLYPVQNCQRFPCR